MEAIYIFTSLLVHAVVIWWQTIIMEKKTNHCWLCSAKPNMLYPTTKHLGIDISNNKLKLFVDKHEVQLCVNHFTMYCVAGTSKEKRTAYKRKKLIGLSTEQHPSTFSIYCVNSYHQKSSHQVNRYIVS